MTTRILVIGGYGNFGTFISKRLAKVKAIQLIIAGRSIAKAKALATELNAEFVALDINQDIGGALASINPDVVIHTSGPYQAQAPVVACACVEHGCHYIDLADGRDFVKNIAALDQAAKEKGVLVISGASSVPGLTSALMDHYSSEFKCIETLDYAITTAQKFNPGLSTIAAIFSYTGKPFQTLINGKTVDVHGLQSLHSHVFPGAGRRLLGNCDVPDLALFPDRYPDLKTIRFYAGVDVPLVHITLWGVSWLVRIGLIRRLERFASPLLIISHLFNWMGSDVSAFYLEMGGIGLDGEVKSVTFDLTANAGHGPNIPCVPAILLAQKLANGEINDAGAFPCMGFITLKEYLGDFAELDISWTDS
jgi:saccharopine dehydrogenase-like NADP-dependent oxidoreductase